MQQATGCINERSTHQPRQRHATRQVHERTAAEVEAKEIQSEAVETSQNYVSCLEANKHARKKIISPKLLEPTTEKNHLPYKRKTKTDVLEICSMKHCLAGRPTQNWEDGVCV